MELKTVTLGEISKTKGHYGIEASAVNYSDDLYTYLRISDINLDGTINKKGLKSVLHKRADQFLLKPNDIVFARTGNNVGKNYFYDEADGEFVYASFLINFSLDPDKVNPKYIKYYCLSDAYKDWVNTHLIGSTRSGINAKTFSKMKIVLPPRTEQDKLVYILDLIEKKRKVIHEMNTVLLEIADALYQEQFVLTTRSNRKIGRLADLVCLKHGKSPKMLDDGIIPCCGTGGIMKHVNQPLYNKESVLIPRKGSLNNVMYVEHPFWAIDTLFYTEPKVQGTMKYIYHFLRTKNLNMLDPGFTVPSLTKKILDEIKIEIPSSEELVIFESKVGSLYEQLNNNRIENDKLLLLRALLFSTVNGKLNL